MHFQFLVEDMSGGIFIKHVMEKLKEENSEFTYDCKTFKGIGGFRKSGKVNDIKTNKLLDDLVIYLKGFDKSLHGIDAAIIVVLDNDKRETAVFNEQLKYQAAMAMVLIDHVFCIAVEEMEAWLLGDKTALHKAYPDVREAILKESVQDSICGTWEVMANAVFKGGIKKFRKECPTFREVGKYKAEWAEQVGKYIKLDNNCSPSFQFFVSELRRRLKTA